MSDTARRQMGAMDTIAALLAIALVAASVTVADAAIHPGEGNPGLVLQLGHSGAVTALSESPDGGLLLSGGQDGILVLWDIKSGRQIRSFAGHSGTVHSAVFSGDGRLILSGAEYNVDRFRLPDPPVDALVAPLRQDGTPSPENEKKMEEYDEARAEVIRHIDAVKLWDAATGKEIRTFTGQDAWVRLVSFCHGDQQVLAIGDGGKVLIWDRDTGRELRSFEVGMGAQDAVVLSSDCSMIASTSSRRMVGLWDVASGKKIRTFAGQQGSVKAVAVSVDGRRVASGSSDGTVKVWDTVSGIETGSTTGSDSIEAIAFSGDGSRMVISGGSTVRLWDLCAGGPARTLQVFSNGYRSGMVAFGRKDRVALYDSSDEAIRLYEASTGLEHSALKRGLKGSIMDLRYTTDEKYLVVSGIGLRNAWDLGSGKVWPQTPVSMGLSEVAFTPDGRYFFAAMGNELGMMEPGTGKVVRFFHGHSGIIRAVAVSHDGRYLASGDSEKVLILWDVATGKAIRSMRGHSGAVQSAAFSPDDKTVVSGSWSFNFSSQKDTLIVWDVATGDRVRSLEGHAGWVMNVAYSHDGKFILSASTDATLKLWDAESGKEVRTLAGHSNQLVGAVFSPDDRFIFSGAIDGVVVLWDTNSGALLARLVARADGDWLVADPDGRFDTNSLEEIKGLHWVMPDDPFTPLPVEIFMRDYYEPRLLPRILSGEKFKPLRSLTDLNRVQPDVKIAKIEPGRDGTVSVQVEVAGASRQYGPDGAKKKQMTGVHDLRLFRDGQLVAYEPKDEKKTEVQGKKGKRIITFKDVQLPKGQEMKEVGFSAYAFNDDRVKSATDRKTYQLPKHEGQMKRTAYLITVGVNASQNPSWDLQYAANDARTLDAVLHERIAREGIYREIVDINLVSDYRVEGGTKVVFESAATKKNIHAVLELLAGHKVGASDLQHIPNADKIGKASPDDLVLISFSSHGYADQNGVFYILPYDIGPGSGRKMTDEMVRHAVSSNDLSTWLRDVDAGEMVMIVDACHSAAGIEGEGFKPGPMGSRGLGQLAYDKGMKVLTASQADAVALESAELKHGLLTYALVHDGIEAKQADFQPQDRKITLAEWLAYGVERVPKLYEEMRTGNIQKFGRGEEGVWGVAFSSEGFKKDFKKKKDVQQPSLFNFRKQDGLLMKVE